MSRFHDKLPMVVAHRNLLIAQFLWRVSDWVERLGDRYFDKW